MTAFEEMGVLPELANAVEELDWTLPTDVQAEAIPAILGGRDVLMAAETGSGKTGAFCLPVLQIVWESLKDQQLGKTGKSRAAQVEEPVTWVLSVFDRGSAMAIQPDGLLCQSRHPIEWHGARCTHGVVGKGKYYYEATVTDDGLCRVGWSTPVASLDLGTDRQGFGFGGTGKKSFGKQFDDYGESYTLHDTIGCFINLDKKEVTFSKNGKVFPKAFDIPRELHNSAFFPAVVTKNAEISFNFGATPFKHPPTDGYMGVISTPADNVAKSPISGGAPAPPAAPKNNAPMCIIIEPTRELAEQTHAQIEKFRKHLNSPTIRTVLVIGSVPARDQQDEIKKGVDIITCTPGRLEDFISTRILDLSQVRFFVLDEADGLLSGGYSPLIERIHHQIPKITYDSKRLQMIVCSATLHNSDVNKLADKMMHFPQWVDLKGQDSVPDTVHHVVVPIDPKTDRRWMRQKQHVMTDGIHARDDLRPGSDAPETLSEAVKILKGEYVLQAIREHKMDRCLIFCRTKVDCDNLESYLVQTAKDFTCVTLHSDRKPEERTENLKLFKDGKAHFLICTDVAARGIDICGMPYVINVTLPDDKANYLHRIGRVGRAERMGLAISLVSTVPEKVWWHTCSSKGKGCNNTRLTTQGGCAIWYDELALLGEIEDHLGITIQQVDQDIKVPLNEYDGKVVYGSKKLKSGCGYQGHAVAMAPTVLELADLERTVQLSYLKMRSARHGFKA